MYFEDEYDFHSPTELEHEKILSSAKKIMLEQIIWVVLFVAFLVVPFAGMYLSMSSAVHNANENIDISGFTETEEDIIKEVYGDRKAYADRKTKDKKKNFIDKKKSKKKGKIIYKEKEFQKYYDSFLEEYDKKINKELVKAKLDVKKQEYILQHKNRTLSAKNSLDDYFFIKIFPFIILTIFVIVISIRQYKTIVAQDYDVITGTVTDKRSGRFGYRRYRLIKRRITVSYQGGDRVVYTTSLQSLTLSVGTRVYLVRNHKRGLFGRYICSVCKC